MTATEEVLFKKNKQLPPQRNFNESCSILVMLASYGGLLSLGVPTLPLRVLLGLATSALVGLLIRRCRGRPRRGVPAQA